MFRKRMRIAPLIAAIVLTTSLIPVYLPAQAQQSSPVAPRKEQVQAIIREAYEKFKGDTGGKNADYIPILAQVDSKLFGVAVVTTDNQVVSLGDTSFSFSIQSISKVFFHSSLELAF